MLGGQRPPGSDLVEESRDVAAGGVDTVQLRGEGGAVRIGEDLRVPGGEQRVPSQDAGE